MTGVSLLAFVVAPFGMAVANLPFGAADDRRLRVATRAGMLVLTALVLYLFTVYSPVRDRPGSLWLTHPSIELVSDWMWRLTVRANGVALFFLTIATVTITSYLALDTQHEPRRRALLLGAYGFACVALLSSDLLGFLIGLDGAGALYLFAAASAWQSGDGEVKPVVALGMHFVASVLLWAGALSLYWASGGVGFEEEVLFKYRLAQVTNPSTWEFWAIVVG
ncbi:hypothetical protein KDL45_07220, partial [bacterium]|nr:hypothetical protein [bacterium]